MSRSGPPPLEYAFELYDFHMLLKKVEDTFSNKFIERQTLQY